MSPAIRQEASVPLLEENRTNDENIKRTSFSNDDGARSGRLLVREEGDEDDFSESEDDTPNPDSLKMALERKYKLVDQEIDRQGMGRYQWFVWSLCGLGYLLDLLWAQAFGLVLGPLQQELGFPASQSGDISVAFSIGLTAGAVFWGIVGDVIGRRWAFNLTCLISAIFGAGLGTCGSYGSFLTLTVFTGFGIGGNIPVDTTICLEFIPSDRRFLLALLSIFQPIGVVSTSILAYIFIPSNSCSPNFAQDDALPACSRVGEGEICCTPDQNRGWRYLLLTIGCINIAVFLTRFIVFNIQESPKFLLNHGRNSQAIEVLQNVAKTNQTKCGLSMSDFASIDADSTPSSSYPPHLSMLDLKYWRAAIASFLSNLRQLFSSFQTSRLTLLIWLTYICDFWGFTLAGHYFPQIIAIKNSTLHLTLQQTYLTYIFIYAPGILGVLLAATLVRVSNIWRRWTMVASSAAMGGSILLFSFTNTRSSNLALNALEYFFQSTFNAVLYGYTPEAFPAAIRGTACGIATFWGRSAGIIAPVVAQKIIGVGGGLRDLEAVRRVLLLAGGVTVACILWTGLLPGGKR